MLYCDLAFKYARKSRREETRFFSYTFGNNNSYQIKNYVRELSWDGNRIQFGNGMGIGMVIHTAVNGNSFMVVGGNGNLKAFPADLYAEPECNPLPIGIFCFFTNTFNTT